MPFLKVCDSIELFDRRHREMCGDAVKEKRERSDMKLISGSN